MFHKVAKLKVCLMKCVLATKIKIYQLFQCVSVSITSYSELFYSYHSHSQNNTEHLHVRTKQQVAINMEETFSTP